RGDWPVVFIQQSSDQTDYSGLSLIQSLRLALDNNDFKLVYQPVMDLKNHNTSYFEALLRWKRPKEHVQSIEKTIALAEKNQLIKPLSHWIIETACLQLQKMADSPVKIAINLSMIDFHDEGLPQRIGKILQRYGVAPGQLMIEITEGQFMQEPDLVISILKRLSDMGISLSIDDFGTGQASLTYLKRLPVEKLKIDQSFIKNMVDDEEDSTIVEATIKLAHTLRIEVVAEGVESAEIHTLLKQMGCDYVQGYYISRPLDSKLLKNWMSGKNRPSYTGLDRTGD
ncbi:MAG: EAL domain-containing protein, partial [Thiotrichaceae bacterium]|nr:EAL domain-containing protein [Thiotrichaceae bacterium]